MYIDPGKIVISTPGSLAGRALICNGCGKIFCGGSCSGSLRGIGDILKCDSCGGDISLPTRVSLEMATAWVKARDVGASWHDVGTIAKVSDQTARDWYARLTKSD